MYDLQDLYFKYDPFLGGGNVVTIEPIDVDYDGNANEAYYVGKCQHVTIYKAQKRGLEICGREYFRLLIRIKWLSFKKKVSKENTFIC